MGFFRSRLCSISPVFSRQYTPLKTTPNPSSPAMIRTKPQMGFSKPPLLSSFLVLLIVFSFLTSSNSAADIFSLVYKGCANHTTSDISTFQSTLTALFNALLSQSSASRFFKTSSGSGQNAISGLFQCRGDLSNAECSTCVSRITQMAPSLCGDGTVAGRIQLAGCYLHYEVAGFLQISGTELQFKTCGKSDASFEEKRDTAFSQLETGIAGGSGFYATTYASVYVIAQCEGDLSVGDCGECVKEAVQRAEVECGEAVSGQVYLNRCYISYSYYPNGVSENSSSGSRQQTGKTAAIIVGGAFALFFVVICLLFIRQSFKKKDDS